MNIPTLAITSPTSGSTVGTSFTVRGTCSENHQITVAIENTNLSNQTTPTNGSWSTGFSNVSNGSYTIKASCGNPQVSASVNDVTVG
jgi:hypothetical protein